MMRFACLKWELFLLVGPSLSLEPVPFAWDVVRFAWLEWEPRLLIEPVFSTEPLRWIGCWGGGRLLINNAWLFDRFTLPIVLLLFDFRWISSLFVDGFRSSLWIWYLDRFFGLFNFSSPSSKCPSGFLFLILFSRTSFVFLLFSTFLFFSNFVVFDVLCSGWSDVVSESELVLRDVDLCDSGSCVVVCWKFLFLCVVSSSGNTNI